MKHVLITAAAVLAGVAQLALGWRLSVLGAAPDLMFVIAAFVTARLRPGEGVPVACGIGLLADFLVGGRLGLMALGYGLGARVVEGLRPVVAPGLERSLFARASAAFLLALAGAAAAHGTAAVLGAMLDAGGLGLAVRAGRAAMIAFLTGIAAAIFWPTVAAALGWRRAPARWGGDLMDA